MIYIFIGPNGFGKTTKLKNERDALIKQKGVGEQDILFLESEILLMDEVKDTKDETKTMEFVFQELLMSSADYLEKKAAFEKQIKDDLLLQTSFMNGILESVLALNGNQRTPGKDFVSPGASPSYKGFVKIETKDIKEKTGSGQRMQLILELIARTQTKKYIFLDEPEKYSHPSMLNKTAKLIQNLDERGLEVYIATHSPKLLSMLDFPFENLFVINDTSHNAKPIDFDSCVKHLSKTLSSIEQMPERERSFYSSDTLKENIKRLYYRDFIECLFSKRVFLCEGVNDRFFILKALRQEKRFFDDYCIFQTFGKFTIPVFLELFSLLGITVQVFFDEDTEKREAEFVHNQIDSYLENFPHYEFKPNIEEELGYEGKKQNTLAFIDHLEKCDLSTQEFIRI